MLKRLVVSGLVVLFLLGGFVCLALARAPKFERFCILQAEVFDVAQYFERHGMSQGRMYVLKSAEEVVMKALEPMLDQITHIYFIADSADKCGSDPLYHAPAKDNSQ